jgi:hypothetical protein
MEDKDYLVEPPKTISDPRDLLIGYLDGYRDALLRKFDEMSEDDQRRSVLPSGWTPLELLNHLAHVERRWFRWGFTAEAIESVWGDWDEDRQRWAVHEGDSVQDVRARFLDSCERSRGIVAGAALDEVSATGGGFEPDEPHPTLIWILFHVLQEYARHVGHLDVVRELADGTVGS